MARWRDDEHDWPIDRWRERLARQRAAELERQAANRARGRAMLAALITAAALAAVVATLVYGECVGWAW